MEDFSKWKVVKLKSFLEENGQANYKSLKKQFLVERCIKVQKGKDLLQMDNEFCEFCNKLSDNCVCERCKNCYEVMGECECKPKVVPKPVVKPIVKPIAKYIKKTKVVEQLLERIEISSHKEAQSLKLQLRKVSSKKERSESFKIHSKDLMGTYFHFLKSGVWLLTNSTPEQVLKKIHKESR